MISQDIFSTFNILQNCGLLKVNNVDIESAK